MEPLRRPSIVTPTSAALGLIVVIGVAHMATIRSGHDWGDDFAMHILHARNLAEGLPYEATGYLYNPKEPIAPPSYPPVFPLFLSLIYRWFGLNLTAMKIGLILVFLASLVMIFFAVRDEAGPRTALAVIALVGLNPYFWEFKDQILSDTLFLFLTSAGCVLVGRAHQPHRTRWVPALYALAGGVAILLACETRTVGLTLIPAVIITGFLRHRRSLGLTGLALLPIAVSLLLRADPFHYEVGYLRQLRPFNLSWTLMNADHYTRELRNLWRNDYSGVIMRGVFLSMNGLALVGFVSRLRRAVTLYEVFAPLYTMAVLLWPHYQGVRFFIPVIPLYAFYAVVGLERLTQRWRGVATPRALGILLGTILISYAARYTKVEYGPIREGVGRPETIGLFDYLKRQTPPEAVCLFSKPRLLALFTGRRSSVYHTAPDEELLDYINRIGVDYVIVNRDFWRDQEFLLPFVQRHPDRLTNVYTHTGLSVYRVNAPEGPSWPSGSTDSRGSPRGRRAHPTT